MSLHLFTLDEKIDAMHIELTAIKRAGFKPGSAQQRQYNVLKAITADLRAQQIFPRSLPLGELERALESMKAAKPAGLPGYPQDKMAHVANIVIHRWPFIRQALEAFGEETAE
jgi:hypothetical protein